MNIISKNTINKVASRDSSIDFLRVLGLCMVTIVHVNAPYSVELLAYCGVPLMVFVSGLCVNTSKVQFSWQVLLHRLKRLLVPLWFFLTIYWLIFYRIVNPKFYEVVQTFAMLGVAPYVWIIRVFIILACLTPVLVKMLRMYNQRITGGAFVIVAIILQEILCYIYAHCSILHYPVIKLIMRDYILYIIPYALIFMSAIYLKTAEYWVQVRSLVLYAILLAIACLIFRFVSNDWENTYWLFQYKYPPRYMYTLYGLFGVQFIYLFRKYFEQLGKNRLVVWISRNSLWIYFYHIPCVQFIPFHLIDNHIEHGGFVIRWIVCITIACVLTALQNTLNNIVVKKWYK